MNEPFFKVPKRLIKDFKNKEINSLALNIYFLFLQRSSFTKLKDATGNSYFIYSKQEIAKELKMKPSYQISLSIKTLEEKEYIRAVRSKGKATKYYID